MNKIKEKIMKEFLETMPILSTSLMRTSLVEKELLNLKTVWNLIQR